MIRHARLALILALLSVVGLAGVAAPATAAPVSVAAPGHSGTQVKLNEDVLVTPDQVVGAVVAVNGNAIVAGTVNGSVVTIGGDVTL